MAVFIADPGGIVPHLDEDPAPPADPSGAVRDEPSAPNRMLARADTRHRGPAADSLRGGRQDVVDANPEGTIQHL
jgi:hypothetical protein